MNECSIEFLSCLPRAEDGLCRGVSGLRGGSGRAEAGSGLLVPSDPRRNQPSVEWISIYR